VVENGEFLQSKLGVTAKRHSKGGMRHHLRQVVACRFLFSGNPRYLFENFVIKGQADKIVSRKARKGRQGLLNPPLSPFVKGG
jgi:hypothetical protein